MRKTVWKRLHVLLVTLSVLLCTVPLLPLYPPRTETAVYADEIDDWMDMTTLAITQKSFGSSVKAELPEKNTWTGRTYESSRNAIKSIAIGKSPDVGKWLGGVIGSGIQWGISKVNKVGKWGMGKFSKLALDIPRTLMRKGHYTQKYLAHLNAKAWYQRFQKLAGIKMKTGWIGGGLNRFANLYAACYGFKSMWETPKVGFKSPWMELCGNSLRGIGSTAALVSAFAPPGISEGLSGFSDAFLIGDIIINSPLGVDLANRAVDGLRDLDTKWGHPLPTSVLVGLMDIYDIEVDTANGTMQDFFSTVFFEGPENIKNWWNYLIWGVEGDENEQNLRELQRKAKGNTFQGNGVGVYKPNIYLYPETETDVRVTFAHPELLTVSDPIYGRGWEVTAEPDGTLYTGGNSCGYLFYESLTDSLDYQQTDGFVIPADAREETFTEILRGYGLNETEIADFNEFWCEKLDAGIDYAMYPQTNETLDVTMPVTVSPAPDSIGRIWFAFEKNGIPAKQAEPETFARDGFTVIEWGGFFF